MLFALFVPWCEPSFLLLLLLSLLCVGLLQRWHVAVLWVQKIHAGGGCAPSPPPSILRSSDPPIRLLLFGTSVAVLAYSDAVVWCTSKVYEAKHVLKFSTLHCVDIV